MAVKTWPLRFFILIKALVLVVFFSACANSPSSNEPLRDTSVMADRDYLYSKALVNSVVSPSRMSESIASANTKVSIDELGVTVDLELAPSEITMNLSDGVRTQEISVGGGLDKSPECDPRNG